MHGSVDCGEELAADGVEVDRVAQPQRERGDDRLGVVAGAVEAPVDETLHAQSQRVEQRGGGQRRGGDPTGEENGSTSVASTTIPTNTPTSRPVMIR